MTIPAIPTLDSTFVLNARGPKNEIPTREPYAFLRELEANGSGGQSQVGTIFLSNRECPFRCLMCDLWKNTTDHTVSADDLITQIRFALEFWKKEDHENAIRKELGYVDSVSEIQHWKLYNAGNFFDSKAIPKSAVQRISHLANDYSRDGKLEKLIIECHPKLVTERCLEFRDELDVDLEIAMGLETIHPEVLPRLNKQMTLELFEQKTNWLIQNGIDVRAFILLRPPFLTEEEGIEWSINSVEWAMSIGVNCCAVIPTRKGNGSLEILESQGHFEEPELRSLELVIDILFADLKPRYDDHRRILVDLWDAQRFHHCQACYEERIQRLHQVNLTQESKSRIQCAVCNSK